MAELSVSSVVRDLLTSDPEMPTDHLIGRAKAAGLRVADEKIRKSIHNQRNPIRAKVAASKVAPATAREIAPPKVAPAVSAPAAPTPVAPDLAGVSEWLGYNRGRSQTTRIDSLWYGEAAGINKFAFLTALDMAA